MMFPKEKRYRNKKILAGAKGQLCQHCGNNDGTIVAAHSNKSYHGKGMSRKADDDKTAYLCAVCHERYDNPSGNRRKLSQEEFEIAMKKTQEICKQNGWLE